MLEAFAAINRKVPAIMIRCRKDAARAILRGEPNRYVSSRPLRIAQRFARYRFHLMERAGDPA